MSLADELRRTLGIESKGTALPDESRQILGRGSKGIALAIFANMSLQDIEQMKDQMRLDFKAWPSDRLERFISDAQAVLKTHDDGKRRQSLQRVIEIAFEAQDEND